MIVTVTAGIILKGNSVLVVQRKRASPRGLFWEFPGGKLEKDESPRQCLRRELQEELGIEVETGRRFEIVYHQYPDGRILLLSYLCRLIQGEPRALDCNRARWVTEKELRDLPMTEADLPLRNALCADDGLLKSAEVGFPKYC
jgi:8-oxo-dGTP diphosphatase